VSDGQLGVLTLWITRASSLDAIPTLAICPFSLSTRRTVDVLMRQNSDLVTWVRVPDSFRLSCYPCFVEKVCAFSAHRLTVNAIQYPRHRNIHGDKMDTRPPTALRRVVEHLRHAHVFLFPMVDQGNRNGHWFCGFM
jgi:hypothetical protein